MFAINFHLDSGSFTTGKEFEYLDEAVKAFSLFAELGNSCDLVDTHTGEVIAYYNENDTYFTRQVQLICLGMVIEGALNGENLLCGEGLL